MEHKKKLYLVTVISINKEAGGILLCAGFYPVVERGAGGKFPPKLPSFLPLMLQPVVVWKKY